MKYSSLLAATALTALLTACDGDPAPPEYGSIHSSRSNSAGCFPA